MTTTEGRAERITDGDAATLIAVLAGALTLPDFDVAMRWKAGTAAKSRARLPAPDAYAGRTPLWARSTFERWRAERPGQGAGGGRPRKVDMPPPTHPFAGESKARAEVGDPGHCERCALIGHVAAHPNLGCGDVGCTRHHEGEEQA